MAQHYRPRGGQKWENRYAYNAVSENADETEWSAIINGSAHFSAGVVDDIIAETGDDLAPMRAREDRLQGGELINEALQGTLTEVLLERKQLLGDTYPFEIHGNTLTYTPSDTVVYEALLGICQAPSLSAAPYCELARLFERLSVLAGRGYLGPRARGYRSGWPRPTGEANRFKALISDIKAMTGNFIGEWFWRPSEELPDDPTSRNIKENGLDVVIWNPWPDGRNGQFYVLGQCACGADWLEKFNDLDTKRLNDWTTLPHVPPLRGFFTPRYVVNALLPEASKEAGLIFDRIRIVHSLSASHISSDIEELAAELTASIAIAQQPMPAAA